MKKALNAWTVEASLDFETTFAAVKSAGFDALELNLDAEGKSAHAFTLASDVADYAAVRGLIEKYGLPVPSISTSLWGGKMGHPEEWEQAEAVLHKQIEIAKAVGADGVLIVPGGMNDAVSLNTARRNCIVFLKSQQDYVAKEGIFVGLFDEVLDGPAGRVRVEIFLIEKLAVGENLIHGAFDLADVGGDILGDVARDLVLNESAPLGGLVLHDGKAGFKIGRLHVDQKTPLEAGA